MLIDVPTGTEPNVVRTADVVLFSQIKYNIQGL